MEIYTTAGYRSSSLEKNHGKAAAKQFMQTNKDWRNVECTLYIKLAPTTSTKGIAWSVRGGSIALPANSNGNCKACGYQAYLDFSGNSKFAKMEYFGQVNNTMHKAVTSDIESRWVGFKFCCFNFGQDETGADVGLEVWIDENESNSWKKVYSYSDRGSWGNGGEHCGGTTSQVISWGGPVATLAVSGLPPDTLFKKVSVREINYNGVFNEGGSNAGGGQQNGGTGNTGSGSGGGTTPPGTGNVSRCTSVNSNIVSNSSNSTTPGGFTGTGTDTSGVVTNGSPINTSNNNNSNTGAGGGNVDRFGVQSAYARGQIRYDWKENFRDDGKRFDFTGLGSSFASCELIGYYRHDGSLSDEVAGKMGGGRHSSGSSPKCYVLGIDTSNGAVRYRLEDKHPSTGGGKSGPGAGQGGGIGFINRWVGYRFVKRNQPNGVLLEIWQDQGNNDGNSPANQWKKIMSHIDTEKNWKNPPSDHQETIRIDEESSLKWKWISLREIRDGDSGTAAGNPPPGNTSGSISTGSGGGGEPFGPGSGFGGEGSSTCSCDSRTGGSGSGTGNDMCDSDGDGIPDTPGSGGGAQPEPPPIETLTTDFTVLYNIAVNVTDSCTFGNPLEVLPYEEVYKADPDANQYQDLGYLSGAGNSAVGLIVANTESELYNKIPRKIVIKAIKRTVDSETNTCEGDLYLRVRSSVLENQLRYQFGSPVDVATIDVNDQELTFTMDDNKEPLKVGDIIALEYLNNSAATDKCLKVKHTEKDKVQGVNTYLTYRRSTGWVFSDRDKDLAAIIYT